MRSSNPSFLVLMAALFCLTPQKAPAQSAGHPAPAGPNQEQALRELVDEVRQLRIAVQRMSSAAYRAQIMADRLKAQQDQVARLTRELSDTRDQVGEVRGKQLRAKEMLEEMGRQKEMGLKGEAELKVASAEVENLRQREQRLMERESNLSTELGSERVELANLKLRLDALEQEIAPPVSGEKRQPSRKQ